MCIYSSRSMSSSSIGSLSRSSFSVITSTNSCMRPGNNCTPSMYTPWSHIYTIYTITICKNANVHSRTNMHARERARGKYFFSGGISKEADGDELMLKHVCGLPWPRAHSVKPYKRSRELSLSSHLKPRNSQAHCKHIQETRIFEYLWISEENMQIRWSLFWKTKFLSKWWQQNSALLQFYFGSQGFTVSLLHWSTISVMFHCKK